MIGKVTLFDATPDAQAELSPCGRYRYTLARRWDHLRPQLFWLLLNPSTADAAREDATTRRLAGFARLWNYGGYVLCNLFAYRATDPRDLLRASDPVGPDNDAAITRAVDGHLFGEAVCGWGAHGRHRGRDAEVLALLARLGVRPVCLGRTKGGLPRHPLYAPGAATRTPLNEESHERGHGQPADRPPGLPPLEAGGEGGVL